MLKALKTQLRNSSYYSLVEKRLLWSAFTLAFYTFLRAGEFTDSSLPWSDVQSSLTTITIHLRQSKTDLLNLFTDLITTRTGLLYCGARFNPLSREKLTSSLCMLFQLTGYDQHSYASHSFRIGAATTVAAANLPAWLIKAMGRGSSDAYQTYIQCPASTLQAILCVLSRTIAAQQPAWDPDAN